MGWVDVNFWTVCFSFYTETSLRLLPCLCFKIKKRALNLIHSGHCCELPFQLWLLFIWGEELFIAVAWESRSWDTFLFAGLCDREPGIWFPEVTRDISPCCKWVNNQCSMTSSIKRGGVKSSSCHKICWEQQRWYVTDIFIGHSVVSY